MSTPNEPNSAEKGRATPVADSLRVLRQSFFERVLSQIKSPMDMLPALENAFPPCATLADSMAQLDDLKRCLDSFRPLNAGQLERLQLTWDTEYTYESNRIEGNTLTLSETSLVINEGITVAGKTINEHLEAINHKDAVNYLRSIATGQDDVSEWAIKCLHELILKNGKNHDDRGRYRSVPVSITGTVYVPPQPWQVPKLMEDLIVHYQEKKPFLHPVAIAADVHAELVGIHPFVDGNGRTSRLVMNMILLRSGFPLANISGERANRLEYYNTLNASHIDHEDDPFRSFVVKSVRESLFRYLAMVSGNSGTDAQDKGTYFFERMKSAKIDGLPTFKR
jgi:Fic family protein